MEFTVYLLIRITIVIIISFFLGNGVVVLFNHLPYKWFLNEGESPTEDIIGKNQQRLTSTPWKWIFTGLFGATSIYIVITMSLIYSITVLIVMNLLLIATVSDIKYGIIPDQINILVAISAIGFFSFHDDWTNQLYGAIAGLFILLVLWAIGKAVYKKDAIGGGDIKMYASLGLVLGLNGIIITFIISTFLGAIHFAYLLAQKRISLKDSRPMMPYIFASFIIYTLFLWDFTLNL